MSTPFRDKRTSQSANFSIPIPQHHRVFTKHQVTVMAGTATAGTVALKFKPWTEGNGVSSPVLDGYGAAISAAITAGSSATYVFEADLESYELDVSGLDGTVHAYVTAW